MTIHILDLAGNLVCQLKPEGTSIPAGPGSVDWKGLNAGNRFAGTGTYIYVFYFKDGVTNKETVVRKPIFLVK